MWTLTSTDIITGSSSSRKREWTACIRRKSKHNTHYRSCTSAASQVISLDGLKRSSVLAARLSSCVFPAPAVRLIHSLQMELLFWTCTENKCFPRLCARLFSLQDGVGGAEFFFFFTVHWYVHWSTRFSWVYSRATRALHTSTERTNTAKRLMFFPSAIRRESIIKYVRQIIC